MVLMRLYRFMWNKQDVESFMHTQVPNIQQEIVKPSAISWESTAIQTTS